MTYDLVFKVARAGGGDVVPAAMINNPGPYSSQFAFDDQFAYWASGNSIERLPIAGGAEISLVIGEIGAYGLSVQGGPAYFVNVQQPDPGTGELRALDLGGRRAQPD